MTKLDMAVLRVVWEKDVIDKEAIGEENGEP